VDGTQGGNERQSAVLLRQTKTATRTRVLGAHQRGHQLRLQRRDDVALDGSHAEQGAAHVPILQTRRTKKTAAIAHEGERTALLDLVDDEAHHPRN